MNVRVVEALNRALHTLFAEDPAIMLLGEDVLDPYAGAFKVTRGLSTRFPDRVLGTPISEQALVGIATGLALTGHKPIVEIMFGDFLGLAFDPLINLATKSVAMYGEKRPLHLVVRCPVGARRGYGPTHSQQLQKHLIGVPHLSLFELSPFHPPSELLRHMLNLGQPCVLFEDKVLYTENMSEGDRVDELFASRFVDAGLNYCHLYGVDAPPRSHCLLIAPGGLAGRCLSAARELLLEFEIETQILIPAQLYPFGIEPIRELLASAEHIFVVEEGTAGGTWGAEVAQRIYARCWEQLSHPIRNIHSRDSIIPTALHLEQHVIVQSRDICRAVVEAVKGGPACIR
jgi:pyruvate dehydrogenase E1 component beta subunit